MGRLASQAYCHYSGSMASKITVRLPDHVAVRLRRRSDAAGLSLNETLVRALERGLDQPAPAGEEDDEWWRELGDLVERPPLGRHDPAEVKRLTKGLRPGRGSILEDLEWTRGER